MAAGLKDDDAAKDCPIVCARSVPDLTIIVPTINSQAYIDLVLSFYARELDVPVTVFVDHKSADATLEVARGAAADVRVIRNESSRVGEIVETMSRQCGSRWILRIDCDELPSAAMMEFVRDAILIDEVDAYSFPRYECAVAPDGKLLRHTLYDAETHRQWRLYRADRVRYQTTGHTPNFHLDDLVLADAPVEAAMIHLSWALHDRARRMTKVARYDTHTPNDGSQFRSLILYEEEPGYQRRFRRLYLPEFDRVTRTLAERFPSLAVKPRSCALGALPLDYELGETLAFQGTLASTYLGRGWSVPEEWGRWAEGHSAELRVSLPELPDSDLALDICACVLFGAKAGRQIVTIYANDRQVERWASDSLLATEVSVRIPAEVIRGRRLLTLRFEIDAPVSPKDLGTSADERVLGFGLLSARISLADAPPA